MLNSGWWLVVLLGGMGLCSRPSFAKKTGNDLLEDCRYQLNDDRRMTPAERLHSAACVNYIAGIADGVTVRARDTGTGIPCIPAETTARDLSILVLTYMRNHYEELAGDAAHMVVYAIYQSYPCKATHGAPPPPN
jgi:hypothetical protein